MLIKNKRSKDFFMKMLIDLPRNAKYSIIVEPLWAVFGGMIFFYVPLYMKELGLSELEMGTVNTVYLFIAFICHFFAGPITNRIGRKKTTLVFDILSWSIPMFIWAVAQNFWFFLLAAVINALVKVVVVSWFCLITEDTPQDKRAKVFGIIYVINYAAGIFTPVTGFFIARYGTVPTMRFVYALGLISMTSMFLIRNAFVTETHAGMELMQKHGQLSFTQSIKSYISTVLAACRNKNLILISLIYIITNFILSMNFFQVLYMKEYLEFGTGIVSATPGISAVINVLLYIIVVPRLKRFNEEKILTNAISVGAAGSFMFLLIPKSNIYFLIITISILAVGNFIMQTYRDSVFMNKLGEHEKADMFSAVQTFTTLICIPSGYIAGYAYSISPKLPFVLISVLFIAALIVSLLLIKSISLKNNISNNHECNNSF